MTVLLATGQTSRSRVLSAVVIPTHAMTTPSSRAAKAVARALGRDHMIKCHTPLLRLALSLATNTVNDGLRRHGIDNPKAMVLYARTLVATSLMSTFLKGEERCIVQFIGDYDDDVTKIYAEALALGELRGYASGPGCRHVQDPGAQRKWWNGRLNVKEGSLSVSRILYNHATPVQSITALQGGDVESDLLHWYRQSEQIPTILRLEVALRDTASLQAREQGPVAYAGGILSQAIATGGGIAPTSTGGTSFDSLVARVSRRSDIDALDIPGYTEEDPGAGQEKAEEFRMPVLQAQGLTLTQMAQRLLPEYAHTPPPAMEQGYTPDSQQAKESPFTRIPLDLYCRCSKDKFASGLGSLGPSLLSKMKSDYMRDHPTHVPDVMITKGAPGVDGGWSTGSSSGPAPDSPPVATLACQFCNNEYHMSWADMCAVEQASTAGGIPEAAPPPAAPGPAPQPEVSKMR